MRRNNLILSLLFIFLYICLPITSNIVHSKILTESLYNENYPTINSDISDEPILIDDDNDFVTFGFPGSGTLNNPFRIEYKVFSLDNYTNCIEIYNTTKHFVISSCYFETNGTGILITKVANNSATVANNVFISNYDGAISISNTSFVRIENNTGKLNFFGISVLYCIGPIIINNSFYGGISIDHKTWYGIILGNSNNSYVINNTINNFNHGIFVINCFDSLFENNFCLNTRQSGSFYFYWCSNMVLKDNLVYNNLQSNGIEFYNTNFSRIYNNTIHFCAQFGISLLSSSYNNYIYHNNLLYNDDSSSQAFDEGINNIWYNETLIDGNFWSDWVGTGVYQIAGVLNNDSYPLNDIIGISWDDVFIPNTSFDDSYEDNDFVHQATYLTIDNAYFLYYADIDLFKIHLNVDVNYYFTLDFDFSTTNLDFYLISNIYTFNYFHLLTGSQFLEANEYFTFTGTYSNYYYLLVIGDLEFYKEISPIKYVLKFFTVLPDTPTNLSIQSFWFCILFLGFALIYRYKKNNKK